MQHLEGLILFSTNEIIADVTGRSLYGKSETTITREGESHEC